MVNDSVGLADALRRAARKIYIIKNLICLTLSQSVDIGAVVGVGKVLGVGKVVGIGTEVRRRAYS